MLTFVPAWWTMLGNHYNFATFRSLRSKTFEPNKTAKIRNILGLGMMWTRRDWDWEETRCGTRWNNQIFGYPGYWQIPPQCFFLRTVMRSCLVIKKLQTNLPSMFWQLIWKRLFSLPAKDKGAQRDVRKIKTRLVHDIIYRLFALTLEGKHFSNIEKRGIARITFLCLQNIKRPLPCGGLV